MTTATTTGLLPSAQWRLVNLLHRKAAFTAARRLSTALTVADADTYDLLELTDRSLVGVWEQRVDRRGEVDLRDLLVGPHRLSVHDDPHLFLRLTAAGAQWVATNPGNLVLHAIAEHGTWRGGRGGDVQRDTGVDLAELLPPLVDHGLVMVAAETGEPVDVGTVRGWRRTSGALHKSWLRLTRAGNRIIDPA